MTDVAILTKDLTKFFGHIVAVKNLNLKVEKGEISISASVDRVEVPLNREVKFTIKIEWAGPQDRYEIENFENPALTNLVIRENSSSNVVEDRNGTQFTVKLYNYFLEPLEMGMGYIDGVIVKYVDRIHNKNNRLVTKRIGVKIVKPVEEGEGYRAILSIISAALIAGIVFGIYKFLRLRAKKKIKELEPLELEIDIEEKYLKELKSIEQDSSKDLNEKLNSLIFYFRKYLSEKFETTFEGKSYQEFISEISENEIEQDVKDKINDIFKRSEVLRFSGQEVTIDDFQIIYGSIEWIIEKYKHKKKLKEVEEKKK